MCEPQWSVEYNLDHQKCRRLDLIKELQKLPDQKCNGARPANGHALYIDGDEADSHENLAHHRKLEQELQKMYAMNTEIDSRALQVAIARELADLDILTITTDRECLDRFDGPGRQHPNSLRSSCAQSCSSSRSGGSSSCCTQTTTISTLPTASTTQPPGSLTSTLSFSAAPAQATRPHRANDSRWQAIRALESPPALHHFRLRQKLGSGDIGSVYLTELRQSGCLFAMKVMDKAALEGRNKTARAVTERDILQVLDHPFLPTLYAHIEDGQYSCLVMEFCPGGDLHVLRQRQASKRFSERAVRFYAAEVLLALEYLHMMGIVYRDLKPENVLVREDGHIMLSDFDLSMKCSVNPTLERVNGGVVAPAAAAASSGSSSPPPCGAVAACAGASAACIIPLGCVSPCTDGGAASSVHPVASCLPMPRMLNRKKARRRAAPLSTLPELHAEPISARSMSFVGTHEYLAPEIILGDGHGSAVDWWTFGIFLFELLYGRTPFKGADHEVTLMNVVTQLLRFPSSGDDVAPSPAAQDLIRGLLIKDPSKRLGAFRGASEIKQHAFFQGVNWALIRCATPPDVPPRYAPPPPASVPEPMDAVAWFEHDAPSSAECLDVPDYELF